MQITKNDIINGAYDELRINGITSKPTGADIEYALFKLEAMAYEFRARNICCNYNFTDEPDPADYTNIPMLAKQCFETSLALRLVARFGKNIPQALSLQASQSLSTVSSALAQIRPIQYPHRMPRGSGNTLRSNRWQRFYRPPIQTPLTCRTKNIVVGDINDYYEDWTQYLNNSEDITSYELVNNDGVTIISDSLDSPRVNFRVQGNEIPINVDGLVQDVGIVKITINTTEGRINTREINFRLIPNTYP